MHEIGKMNTNAISLLGLIIYYYYNSQLEQNQFGPIPNYFINEVNPVGYQIIHILFFLIKVIMIFHLISLYIKPYLQNYLKS